MNSGDRVEILNSTDTKYINKKGTVMEVFENEVAVKVDGLDIESFNIKDIVKLKS